MEDSDLTYRINKHALRLVTQRYGLDTARSAQAAVPLAPEVRTDAQAEALALAQPYFALAAAMAAELPTDNAARISYAPHKDQRWNAL